MVSIYLWLASENRSYTLTSITDSTKISERIASYIEEDSAYLVSSLDG